jgi:amidase
MFDIKYTTIQEIHKAFKEKQITVRALVLSYLSRIAKIDKCTGGLNSVLEINPDALFIADVLDERLQNGEELTPLFGIPVLLKDNINTADRLHTSAGSVALADNYAPYDAYIVECLRKAGAIILGKANMTEFANYMSRDGMPSGYSSRGGQVLNPYNRSKTPSGSSSGPAVAVAAGLCTVSIGTETAGSIISPAGQNGIVGIKPTLGLVGRSGIIPISSTHDTAGPMTRTVRDAAVILSVIAGTDPSDAVTHSHNSDVPVDYTKYLDKEGLKGVRIGINRSQKLENFILSEEGKAAFDNLCRSVSDVGAILIDNINIDSNFSIGKIMRNEFKACMNYYLSTLHGSTKMKTLKDIIEYNQTNSSIALKYGQSILIDAENNTSGTLTEPDYIEALEEREKTIAELDRLFDENGIDIMLCETFTNIAPFTGFPCMTIPIGQRQDKLPMDSYWIARRFDEATLLKVTYAVEQLIGLCLSPELDGEN